ncbi:MAG: hypothetical protein BRD55_06185 [Bacteroidetes bacterium SW_9_63_38]|nr:MAG: hypothetical protein BRD55_06185 [Bacteroidetes bacterium SW_9_63_38]
MRISLLRTVVLVALLVGLCRPSHAATPSRPAPPSAPPLHGVVWAPPAHPGPALRALNAMHDHGVTAIRLESFPPADTVWSRADSLGLRLFVDLPVSPVPATDLDAALRAARPSLQKIRGLAQAHSSIHAVGLAGIDTSVEVACGPLKTWTQRVHNGRPSLRTYYVTPFTAAQDQCRDAIDLPLLDTRGRDAPVERWHRWQSTNGPVGLGALGTWTPAGATPGLNVPHSPQRQARHLERALPALLATGAADEPPIFVYRWQDTPSALPPTRHYGLHDERGTARPAAEVVSGFYTGRQEVFAFPSGSAASSTPVGVILLAWVLVALLGGLYARNPFVRQTLSRYFAAHGFYRDAVREDRDVGLIENLVLLGGIGLAVGLMGTLTARISAPQPETALILEVLPPGLRAVVGTGLTHPSLTGLFAGGLIVLLLLVWNALLVLTAQLNGSFSLAQGLMLVTWPSWPALAGVPIALVAAVHPPVSTGLLGLVLLIGGGGALLAVTTRVLRDYWMVSGISLGWTLLMLLPSPLSLTLLGLVLLATTYDLPISLLWHLATRT